MCCVDKSLLRSARLAMAARSKSVTAPAPTPAATVSNGGLQAIRLLARGRSDGSVGDPSVRRDPNQKHHIRRSAGRRDRTDRARKFSIALRTERYYNNTVSMVTFLPPG